MLQIRQNVYIDTYDAASGLHVARTAQHNLVVMAGRNLVRDLLGDLSSERITHLALGTGTGAVTATDVALDTEAYRAAFTSLTPTAGGLTVKLYLSKAQGNGYTFTEAGLLTAPSAGTLFARVLLASPLVKTSSIAATIQWDLTFGV